jgi:hypothetical protein
MRTWIGIAIFVAILLLGFILFSFKLSEGPAATPEPAPTNAEITNIQVKDKITKGVHAISGSATVPTACTTLSANSSVIAGENASSTPVIRIDLSAPLDTGMCLELPTAISFTFSIRADPAASIEVYANGAPASTTAL